jgi:hypothetical protein
MTRAPLIFSSSEIVPPKQGLDSSNASNESRDPVIPNQAFAKIQHTL